MITKKKMSFLVSALTFFCVFQMTSIANANGIETVVETVMKKSMGLVNEKEVISEKGLTNFDDLVIPNVEEKSLEVQTNDYSQKFEWNFEDLESLNVVANDDFQELNTMFKECTELKFNQKIEKRSLLNLKKWQQKRYHIILEQQFRLIPI